jgi:TolB-like protein
MASLIPGYEYDIFISYRQKDNKHDGWVTDFVNHLKGELEATFKEDISLYFDINPHDGLLETHDVDESLKEKLKCLIFIPIISRTYCDPKSFAWEHEFKAFIEMASQDQFGLKVKLPNGNVANRVLPIQIHELEADDKKLLENELGGFLRGIEFIYKEPGVNRPLTLNDDEKKNLCKTIYKNQINKVANAIRESITGLKNPDHTGKGMSKKAIEEAPVKKINRRTRIISGVLIVLASIVAGYYFVPKLIKAKGHIEKSIAVLPFKLLSDEPDKQYLADGMMDAITLHLSKINNLRVISRTSVEQYRGTTKTLKSIGRELEVEYLLEGSFQKYGDNARLIVQLIKVKEDSHAWANEYNSKWSAIFSVQSEIAQQIAKELNTAVTPEEKELFNRAPTSNLTAYDLYMKANEFNKEYSLAISTNSYRKAVNLYKAALEIDSSFAKAYTGLAFVYCSRYYWENYFKENFLDSCLVLADAALSFDNQLDEAYFVKGFYYQKSGNIEKSFENYDKALKINPNYYLAYYYKGRTLTWVLNDFVKGIDNYQKALTLIRGDGRPPLLKNLGRAFLDAGFIDKAKSYYNEALLLDGKKAEYLARLAYIEFSLENSEGALRLIKEARAIDSSYLGDLLYYVGTSGHKEEAYLLAKYMVGRYKKSGKLNLVESHRVGYAYWQMGKYKEAEFYFNQQIAYGMESIKLSREIGQRKAAQYDMAATYAFLGDKNNAYKYLDEFDKKNFYPLWWISLAKQDPLFNSLRNEERFQRILQNMEAKYQAEHERLRKWLEENKML